LPFFLRRLEILDGGAEGTLQLRALFDYQGELAKVLFFEINVVLFVDPSFTSGDTR
jgi:hypothetical protein